MQCATARHQVQEKAMELIQVGSAAPDFNVTDDSGGSTQLADYRGQKIVLFFYPKADTPG